MDTASQWSEDNFAGAALGNKSRAKRLVKIAGAIACKAGASLPAICSGEGAQLAGLYRFMNNAAISPESILRPHIGETLAQCRQYPRILCVQDTTELDFSGREVEGLGEIGDGNGQGLLQHSALAMSEEGRLLGVLDINTHVRCKAPENETQRQRQSRRTQTRVWTEAAQRNRGRDFGATRIINICDRGGDRAECLFGFHEAGQGFVIRAMYDRKAQGETSDTRLWEHMRKQEASMEQEMEVPARRKKKGKGKNPGKAEGVRKAKLQVRYAPVEIPPPGNDPRHAQCEALKLWAVYVSEKDAPDKYEPVEWMLLSSEEVSEARQAQQVINYYKQRWQIEEWHRCLKQGCAVEAMQFKSAEAIRKIAAICSVVAVRLLQLKQQSRDQLQGKQPAARVMPEVMVEVVAARAGKRARQLSVKEFYEQVAKTGGWLRRSGDPGWLTLWRGWREIDMMCFGYLIASRKHGKNV
jgi:hypothetical protein